MMSWNSSGILRLAFAFAMTFSLLLAPFDRSAPQVPAVSGLADVERHDTSAAEESDHGHSHDNGWPEEWHGGQADHSHDVPLVTEFDSRSFMVAGRALRRIAPSFPGHGPSDDIERPPRT